MLEAIAGRVAPPGTELAWVGQDFLLGQGLDEGALPLWPGGDPRATSTGPTRPPPTPPGSAPRPLSQTIDELQAPRPRSPRRSRKALA